HRRWQAPGWPSPGWASPGWVSGAKATDRYTRAASTGWECHSQGSERMSLKGAAYIVGAFEHPTRKASDKSVALLHAESAKGALADAGLSKDDVDGFFCVRDAPGLGPLSMV